MNRKVKTLGLAFVAVLAMSAVIASAASANFTASSYPATATATSTGDELKLFGSAIKCTNNSFVGTLSAASNDFTVAPVYNNCKYGVFPMTVNFTSCDYTFTTTTASGKPEVDVECTTANDGIDITVYASHGAHTENKPICHIRVPQQTNLGGLTYTNSGGDVIVSGTVKGIKATQIRTSAVCPTGEASETVEYVIQAGGIKLDAGGTTSIDVG